MCGLETDCSGNGLETAGKAVPFTDNHTLRLDGYEGDIALYDIKGSPVYQGKNKELTLRSGIYLLRWNGKSQLVFIR